jgi:3-dehydroquinate synthase class II
MADVVTWVSAQIAADRHDEVSGPLSAAIEAGLPSSIEQTMLVRDRDELGIITIWSRREDLDAMIASGEEPLARRLLRSAGGTPVVRVLDVVARS